MKNDNINETKKENDMEEIAKQMEEIAKLKEQLEQMKELVSNLNVNNAATVKLDPVKYSGGNSNVSIICNTHGGIRTKFPTWTLTMADFGSRTTVTYNQFQELVNTHRKYFIREYILLDPKHLDIAEEFGVSVFDANNKKFIKPTDLNKIPNMTVRELEDYYENLSAPMQRTFASWYMNKCYDKEEGFYTVDKMKALNNLIKGDLFNLLIQACASEQN